MEEESAASAKGPSADNRRQVELPAEFVRRYPVGAEVVAAGGAHFRVWAPENRRVSVEVIFEGAVKTFGLHAEEAGYFSARVEEVRPGMLYRYRLESGAFPDPASRFQPQGVEGASEIIDPALFKWADSDWRGVPRRGQVLYEMHVGTFTAEGTWEAAMARLAELRRLGITVIELMPVADFAGEFGWGYDGVDLFAPTRLYGRPDAFRAFVNEAHRLGLGVILDVVYNHVGPRGNFLKQFSQYYFTDRYRNEWGEPLNLDGEHSGPVREFVLANAAYWIEEFHLDGLRLDATQQMFDASTNHILGAISRRVREAGGDREVFLVAENEPQFAQFLRPFEEEGYGFDGLWNDDFHHSARVALTGRNEAYYSPYRGAAQEFVSIAKCGFLYQGQYYPWQKKSRGSATEGVAPEQFVNYLQNHDQVANSLRGRRLHELSSPGRYRALTALLLLGPGTPMLFQGQEFGASTPFVYFADHEGELGRMVADGRKEFLSQFGSIAGAVGKEFPPAPGARETFLGCKLDWTERTRHSGFYRLHEDLLRLRRTDAALGEARVDGAVLGAEAFVLRFSGKAGKDRLLLVNLGADLAMEVMPEPLLAPEEGQSWKLMWSSEQPEYGGNGVAEFTRLERWHLPGHSAAVLGSAPG